MIFITKTNGESHQSLAGNIPLWLELNIASSRPDDKELGTGIPSTEVSHKILPIVGAQLNSNYITQK